MEPEEYFGGYERDITSLAELAERVTQVQALADRSGLTFFWRGQANAAWGVHSSLHRGLAEDLGLAIENLLEAPVVTREQQVVEASRTWIRPSVGARLTTVDLMARLQHFGVPTRLLDFTKDPKVATYFAVVHAPASDGRLVIAAARGAAEEEFRNSFTIPWMRATPTKPARWERELLVLDDHQDFPRIINQDGVFLTGGTPSTQIQRRLGNRLLGAKDVRRCMSAPLALHSWAQAERAVDDQAAPGRRPTVASALTLRIPSTAKEQLRVDLELEDYTLAKLFPDPDGFRTHSPIARALLPHP